MPSVNTKYKVHRKGSNASNSYHDYSVSNVHLLNNNKGKAQTSDAENKMNAVPVATSSPTPVVTSSNTITVTHEMSEV